MLNRIRIGLKAVRQLGLEQVGLYALYQLGLRSGHYRRSLPSPILESGEARVEVRGNSVLPSSLDALYPLDPAEHAPLLALADEITAGQVRLFGGEPAALKLEPPGPLAHWTAYELGQARLSSQNDIKFTWEPARFGWVYTLGRAYTISGRETYAHAFWQYFEVFRQANPPYLGPNWTSGQEVALRLMAFIYASSAFSASVHSTLARLQQLSTAVAVHARRLPLTLVYARSQNNNHLLSEAAGLYSAGLVLPGHSQAPAWKRAGWRWFNHALQTQIAADGTYAQHSTNYHRLMLQLALWVAALADLPGGLAFPEESGQRLAAAAGWLSALVDPTTGQVPNLGANDGAYLMPLTPAPFSDFRPVAGAAWQVWGGRYQGSAFSGQRSATCPFGHPKQVSNHQSPLQAFPRAVHFSSRPSHADQLHLDLWWQGFNIAQDGGTYLYNAAPPWQNALASTAVHNTVMVDGQEQMLRAGRFLWLDWAQAEVLAQETDDRGQIRLWVARHDGYRRLGVIHQRRLQIGAEGEQVTVIDQLLPVSPVHASREHTARLYWLLPDWPWTLHGARLSLASPRGEVHLEISGAHSLSLARAGNLLAGPGPVTPIDGWSAPGYGQKVPAAALIAAASGPLPLVLTSQWQFPPVNC